MQIITGDKHAALTENDMEVTKREGHGGLRVSGLTKV